MCFDCWQLSAVRAALSRGRDGRRRPRPEPSAPTRSSNLAPSCKSPPRKSTPPGDRRSRPSGSTCPRSWMCRSRMSGSRGGQAALQFGKPFLIHVCEFKWNFVNFKPTLQTLLRLIILVLKCGRGRNVSYVCQYVLLFVIFQKIQIH